MKAFFKEIFEYHHYFNQKIIDQLNEHKDYIPERTYPLFCHVLNASQIWNSRILKRDAFGVQEIHLIQNCKMIDNNNYKDTLKIIENYNLTEEINYKNSKGEEFSNSIQDILFHVANHSTHHKGQIISDLRQSGIEPVVSDYIFYKR